MSDTNPEDELQSFPDDAQSMDWEQAKAIKYEYIGTVSSTGRLNVNPRITKAARKKYEGPMAGVEVITSKKKVTIHLKVGGPVNPEAKDGRIPMKFSKTGNSFTLPLKDPLKVLGVEVPRGRVGHIPVSVAKMVDGSVCIILHVGAKEFKPGRNPGKQDQPEDEQQRSKAGESTTDKTQNKNKKSKSAPSSQDEPEGSK